ncbi:hypothetical protein pipiens_000701, partial [Culex pipiens pipiens]
MTVTAENQNPGCRKHHGGAGQGLTATAAGVESKQNTHAWKK